MSTSVSVVIALFCVTGFQLTYSVGVEDEIVQYPLGRCQCQSR